VVVIEVRRPFAAADFAGVGARADDLSESALLRFGGRHAETTRLPAKNSAAGPGADAEVGLVALLTASSAALVREGGARLLFGKSLAVQEQEEIRQGIVEPDQIVAQPADSCVAGRTQPPPDQSRRVTVIQVQLPRARAALADRGARASDPVAQTSFLFFLGTTRSTHAPSVPLAAGLHHSRRTEVHRREHLQAALAAHHLVVVEEVVRIVGSGSTRFP
jgi:hypothetical protein